MSAKLTETELRGKIDGFVSELAEGVDAVRASAAFNAWLNTLASFHRYSLGNLILILLHNPNATQVAGFRSWAEKGRYVRRGERGIPILAPCFPKREDKDDVAQDGAARRPMYYRTVYVFDISQTEGEPLPSVQAISTAQDEALRARLMAFAAARAITVAIAPLAGETQGLSYGGRIALAPTASVKTLAHEIAHEFLHHSGPCPEPARRELEAESVAYVVCRAAGVTDGLACPTYIAAWGGNAEALRASLTVIQQTAATILAAIGTDPVEAATD